MAGDEAMGRFGVLSLLPGLGEHVLFVRLQHRELTDLLEITRKIPLARNGRDRNHSHFTDLAPRDAANGLTPDLGRGSTARSTPPESLTYMGKFCPV